VAVAGDDCNDNDNTVTAPITYFRNADGDSCATDATGDFCSSSAPAGWAATAGTDCNDNDATVCAPITYYQDNDFDGKCGDATSSLCASQPPTGYCSAGFDDCNDADATVQDLIFGYVDSDADGRGVGDPLSFCALSLPSGYTQDCCDNCPNTANPSQADCDNDGRGNACAISEDGALDCNENEIPDSCDIDDGGGSSDVNGNTVPDECETDCNKNGLPDSYEVAQGTVADCNGNDIPDTCDIASGFDPDCNENSVPDSCDIESRPAVRATQWSSSEGGNNHWYRLVTTPMTWHAAQEYAESLGAHLATPTSPGENQFVRNLAGDLVEQVSGVWLGASAPPGQGNDPNAYTWVTSEAWSWTNWHPLRPNYTFECGLAFRFAYGDQWNNIPTSSVVPFVIEWSALPDPVETDCDGNGVPDSCDSDCNENGIPDACDIANGDTDKDGDGIPDSCEYARGDFDLNGCVEGMDLAFLLAVWGAPDVPVADLDSNGVVGGGDLTVLLSNWGCGDEP